MLPGIIDGHNHIVLVGNRPGWSTPLEHVFTIPDAIAALKTDAARRLPAGEIHFNADRSHLKAMQFAERRLPTLAELDTVNRAVYIQAAQGGARTNSLGKAWFESKGVTIGADGAIAELPCADCGSARFAQRVPHSRDQETLGIRCSRLLRETRHHYAS